MNFTLIYLGQYVFDNHLSFRCQTIGATSGPSLRSVVFHNRRNEALAKQLGEALRGARLGNARAGNQLRLRFRLRSAWFAGSRVLPLVRLNAWLRLRTLPPQGQKNLKRPDIEVVVRPQGDLQRTPPSLGDGKPRKQRRRIAQSIPPAIVYPNSHASAIVPRRPRFEESLRAKTAQRFREARSVHLHSFPNLLTGTTLGMLRKIGEHLQVLGLQPKLRLDNVTIPSLRLKLRRNARQGGNSRRMSAHTAPSPFSPKPQKRLAEAMMEPVSFCPLHQRHASSPSRGVGAPHSEHALTAREATRTEAIGEAGR